MVGACRYDSRKMVVGLGVQGSTSLGLRKEPNIGRPSMKLRLL
jgi:hypothetical protein